MVSLIVLIAYTGVHTQIPQVLCVGISLCRGFQFQCGGTLTLVGGGDSKVR